MIRCASFDIGKRNFSFCIEEFDSKELEGLENIPESKRYNSNGTPTENMQKILDQVMMNGRIALHDNVDLTKNCDPKRKLDPQSFYNMIDVLNQYTDYWDECTFILVEQQMSFGRKVNTMALKLGQHCYSYFALKYGRTKMIIEFPAYHKTQILGAPKMEGKPYKSGKKRWKAMTKYQRKKWAIDKAIEILTYRGEMNILEGMTSVKKRDDLADTLLMIIAFKYLFYVDLKREF